MLHKHNLLDKYILLLLNFIYYKYENKLYIKHAFRVRKHFNRITSGIKYKIIKALKFSMSHLTSIFRLKTLKKAFT